MSLIHSESMFIDSGAHTLYNVYVLQHSKRKGRHGRDLARPPVRWSQGDFSYYDLSKGSPFRKYCDRYAAFMKKMVELDPSIILANVDAISNPDLTWEIQRFFEEEHGVQPIPIIHYGTPMKYVDRYTDANVRVNGKLERKYFLLGVGGLGQGVSRHEYFRWADEFFVHICPSSNQYLPIIRTHGFAMTSWELMCRYPWWSVDSATWVKLSAYGWLYIPRWSSKKGFRYDKPPMQINFSHRSPQRKNPNKHYTNISKGVKKSVDLWLDSLGLNIGSVIGEGKGAEVDEFGVASHHRARSIANLHYLKNLEEYLPAWPYPLDGKIIHHANVKYQKGFGIL